jgi:O-antigen/teichoic acid export membrane protein
MSTFATEQISVSTRGSHAGEAAPRHERDRRIVISAGVGIFQRCVQIGSTLVLMPLLLRVLGPAKFGVWGAAASLAWLSGLVDIGTGTALLTLVARSSARDRADQARRHVTGALSIGSGLGCLMCLAALLALTAAGGREWVGPYLIAAIGLAINVPLSASNNVWMALQKGYVSAFWELVQTLLTTAALISAASRTTDVRVFVAVVYLGLVAANVGSLLHLFMRHPELRPEGL